MKNAIGSSLLLNIVLVFIGIISAFLVGSIAYSKAYKVKNRIVSIIEKYNGDCFEDNSNPACFNEIEQELTNMGYSSNIKKECKKNLGYSVNQTKVSLVYPSNNYSGGHAFCVYKFTLCDLKFDNQGNFKCDYDSNTQSYYKVYTFMHFDIPVVSDYLEFEVTGETKPFYDTFINIKRNEG